MDLDTELIRSTAEVMYDVVRVVFTSSRSKKEALHHDRFQKAVRCVVCFSTFFIINSVLVINNNAHCTTVIETKLYYCI